MHVIQYFNRIYFSLFLCLCAAVLFAPSLANANDGYWSTAERRFVTETEKNYRVQRLLDQATNKPSNSTLSTAPSSPTITRNASGGLSASTNQILKTMGQPSTFSSTSNFSLNAAKNALKSCVRSPSCAGRTLGGGAIIYDGIKAWKDVYDIVLDDNDTPSVKKPLPVPPSSQDGMTCQLSGVGDFPSCQAGFDYYNQQQCLRDDPSWVCPISLEPLTSGSGFNIKRSDGGNAATLYYKSNSCPSGSSYTVDGCASDTEFENTPVPMGELDQMIDDGYEPAVSDAPIVLLSDTPPSTIELSTPAPAQLPSTTTTNTSSAGTTTTVIDRTINYTVNNNNTANPSISSSVTETSTTYDSNSNVLDTSTSTTTNPAVAPDPLPSTPPTAGSPVELDFELPSFCSWASIVCDWIGWTKESLDEEEPDLSQLITVFEPDEESYDLGIGSGSCPAPMMLNLGIINKTVEVKYDPFCSFLEMIRPFVLAAAYLFAAYMYLGVLRRG